MTSREREANKSRYVKLFNKYDWDLWGRLSAPVTKDPRRHIIERLDYWMDELEEEEGEQDLRWVRTYEKGRDGDDDLVRILIGGLQNRCRLWQERWSSNPLMSHLRDFHKFNGSDAMHYVLDLKHKHRNIDLKYKLR